MRRILFIASVVVLMAGIPLHGATKSAPSEAVSTLPDEDPDGDGLINQQEAERGTMPKNPDTDGDNIEDGFDAVPKNRAMTVLATPENSYAIVDLGSEHFPGGINDNPDALLLRPGTGNTRQEGAVWSKGVLTVIGEGEKGSFRGPLRSRAVFFGSPGETTETSSGAESLSRRISVNKKWAPGPPATLSEQGLYSETSTRTRPLAVLLPDNAPRSGVLATKASGVQDQAWAHMRSQMDPQLEGAIPSPGAPQSEMIIANLEHTNDEGGHTFQYQSRLSQTYYKILNGNPTNPLWFPIDLWVLGEQTQPDDWSYVTGYISWGEKPKNPNFPSQFLVNSSMDRVAIIGTQPYAISPDSSRVPIPGALSIVDMTSHFNAEGPYYLGQSATGLTLWCYNQGDLRSEELYGALPDCGKSNPIMTRRINNRLLVPMGAGIFQNGHSRSAANLCGSAADTYTNWNICQVSPNRTHLLASAVKTSDQKLHALLLVPVDIVPDWNRDGVIDNKDRGKVTEEKPWRYWVNDDDDEGDVGGANDKNSDMPEAGQENGADFVVNGIRDLVDFFPLWLDIKQMLEALPKDQFDYVLESENNSLQYAETALTKKDSDAYLKAELGEVSERNNPNGLASVAVKTITQGLAKLSDEFLQGITDETGGVLLVEAWKETDKPLKLVVKKKSSGEQMCEFPFHLKIDDVEKMFRHKNIRGAVPAWAGRVPGEADRLGEPENYPDDLCINKSFIFVHGYNVNGDQARGWQAEVFKRMFWSGNRAKFYGVSWSGDRNQTGYPFLGLRTPNFHHAVHDAFASSQSLAQFVNGLQGGKTIAAHSLGNLMTSAAQSDFGMSVDNFYLVNAAQSIEQHQVNAPKSTSLRHGDWPNYQERTFASEWYLLPFTQGDARKNLTWRGRVAGHSGQRHNFYSDVSNDLGDHVMRTPSEQTDDDAVIQFNALVGAFLGGAADGSQAFCLQERLKGNFLLPQMGSTYGGWRLTENYDDSTPPSPPNHRTPTAAEANAISDAVLQVKPVFDPGFYHQFSPPLPDGGTKVVRSGAPSWIEGLTEPTTGSTIAQQHQNLLLSEMFPARTLAVGGNPVPAFGARNIDMQSNMRLGWPTSRTSGNRPVAWLHGDLKDVAYTYVFRLFDTWVEIGELK